MSTKSRAAILVEPNKPLVVDEVEILILRRTKFW